jgi:hypothetical protein
MLNVVLGTTSDKVPDRPLEIGEVIDVGFSLWRRSLGTMTVVTLAIGSLYTAVAIVRNLLESAANIDLVGAVQTGRLHPDPTDFALLSLVLAFQIIGAAYVADDVRTGRRRTPRELFNTVGFTIPFKDWLLAATMAVGAVLVIPIPVILHIPGVLVREDAGYLVTLRRSFHLALRRVLKVLWVVAIASLVMLGLGLGTYGVAFTWITENPPPAPVLAVVAPLFILAASTALGTIGGISVSLVSDGIARRDGVDLLERVQRARTESAQVPTP